MKSIFKTLIMIIFSLLLVTCAKKDDHKINLTKKMLNESTIISDVAITFSAVKSTFNNVEWGSLVDKGNKTTSYEDPSKIALNLGSQTVDALVAVIASDWDSAKEISVATKELANKLNVGSSIENLALKLKESIDKQDQKASKELIEQIKNAAKSSLDSMSSQDVAILIQYGAWINTINKVINLLSANYSPENCDKVLRVKSEVNYFLKALSLISDENIKNSDAIKRSLLFLSSMKKTIDFSVDSDGKYPNIIGSSDIKNFLTTTNDIVNLIKS